MVGLEHPYKNLMSSTCSSSSLHFLKDGNHILWQNEILYINHEELYHEDSNTQTPSAYVGLPLTTLQLVLASAAIGAVTLICAYHTCRCAAQYPFSRNTTLPTLTGSTLGLRRI